MREIRTSGSTRGEWVTLNVSPSLLLYRSSAAKNLVTARRQALCLEKS